MNINFSNIRLQACPFYPNVGIQQIITYGTPERRRRRCDKDYAPVRVINIRIDRALKGQKLIDYRLYVLGLLKRNYDKLFSTLGADQQPNLDRERGHIDCQLEEQERIKYSHEIWVILDNPTKLTQYATTPLAIHLREARNLPKSCHIAADRQVDPSLRVTTRSSMIIAGCIGDAPGTLHTILDTFQKPGVQVREAPFVFNIDYMHTYSLGPLGDHEVEIFGGYRPSDPRRASLGNVNGLVFYGGDIKTQKGIRNALRTKSAGERVLDRMKVKKDMAGQLSKTLEVDEKQLETLSALWETIGFRKAKEKPDKKEDFPSVANCPISRTVGCPRFDRFLISQGKSYDVKVRIAAVIMDVPGSLKSLLEILGHWQDTEQRLN